MAKEKILVVDDEKAINKLVCSYLTKEQFRPFPAYTGEEALDLLKKENPDIYAWIRIPDTAVDYPIVQNEKETSVSQ